MAAGFQQVNSRIDQVNGRIDQTSAEMAAGFQRVNADMAAEFHRVNDRIDKLVIAVLAIGGGVLAALIGIIAALLVM